MPATYADVEAIVAELPEVTEGKRYSQRTWFVRGKGFAWERPLSGADIKRWGPGRLPEDPILAIRTEDLAEKEALLAEGVKGVFTMQHFDGYPAVLIELPAVNKRTLRRLVVDAWLAEAPEALARSFLSRRKS
jgi:hypothetical protein